jgi:hypothetical protein
MIWRKCLPTVTGHGRYSPALACRHEIVASKFSQSTITFWPTSICSLNVNSPKYLGWVQKQTLRRHIGHVRFASPDPMPRRCIQD